MGHSYLHGGTAFEIAASVEQATRSGAAKPGDRLPSVREAGELLEVSRNTVALAYGRLRDAGIIMGGAGRGGMRIASVLPFEGRTLELPPGVRDVASGNVDAAFLPALRPVLDRVDLTLSGYDLDGDDPSLVAVIKDRLSADGLDTGHWCFLSGALDAIERAMRSQVRAGSTVVVEDPGFPPLYDLLRSLGLRLKPLTMDGEGPSAELLEAHLAGGASAVVITPRAQNPTGTDISSNRAKDLSVVLSRHPDVLVVLDDHWGPISASGLTLLPPVGGRWLFLRSVSKFLGPDYRVAIALGDAATIDRIRRQQALGPRWVSRIIQRIVAALWASPETDKLVADARAEYRRRREALMDELAKAGVTAHGRSGVHVWVPVPRESEVVQAMLAMGWAVQAGEPFRLESGPAVRIGIANLTPDTARSVARDLAGCLAAPRRFPS